MANAPIAQAPYTAAALAALPYERLATPLPPGAGYSTVYAFGDSLSDVGNDYSVSLNVAPVSPPYDGGRFSNGPLWVEDLTKSLGLPPLTDSITGGNDFAYGGAISGSIPGQSAGPLDLPTQLLQFQAEVPKPAPNALYTLSIGGNDLLDLLGNPADETVGIGDVVSNEVKFIASLASGGARNFDILNVPDLGKTPDIAKGGASAAAAATALSADFDQSLKTALSALAATDHLNIGIIDTFSLLDQITANPSAYGFVNVTTPVWSGNFDSASSGTLVSTDPAVQDTYLFWDSLHPTAATHALIAAAAQTTLA